MESTPDAVDLDEVARIKKQYDEAVAEEQDAASRVAALAEDLRDLGFDPDDPATASVNG